MHFLQHAPILSTTGRAAATCHRLEVLGGVTIIIVWQKRFVALLLAGFCLMSALIFHANFADQNEMIHFMINVALAGDFLFPVVNRGGNYAVYNRTKSV